MKLIKHVLFTILCIVFTGNIAFGSHFAGGNITMTYAGTPNTYLVTLSIYRDCSGANYPNNPIVSLNNNCGLPDTILQLNIVLLQEVSALDFDNCPGLST